MAETAIVINAYIRPDGTLELSEPLDHAPGPVRVVILSDPERGFVTAGPEQRRSSEEIAAEIAQLASEMHEQFRAISELEEHYLASRSQTRGD